MPHDNSDNVIADIMTGNETYEGKTAKIHLFEVNTHGESFIKNTDRIIIHNSNTFPAYPNVKVDRGKWKQLVAQIREGTILKVFSTHRSDWHGHRKQACLYLKARRQAASIKVTIPLPNGPSANFTVGNAISGRFDIINLEEVKKSGISVPKQFEHLADSLLVEEVFNITELEPEIAPRPIKSEQTVESASGKKVTSTFQKRKRMIRLK